LIPSFIFKIAGQIPFQPLLRWSGMRLFLPFYHIISDEPAPHVQPLYPVRTTAQLRHDLDWILRYFDPAPLSAVHPDKARNKPVFHLSFDDGLRQCYDTIAPVLLEKGIPATFFINPAFVGNTALMFRYKAALIAGKVPSLRDQVLAVKYPQQHQLDQLAIENGIDFQHFLDEYQPYMTAAQITGLHQKGFTIGAHSMDHPLYANLPEAEQRAQTMDSLAWVRQEYHIPNPAFAFPFTDFGVKDHFFQHLPDDLLTFGCAGVKKEKLPRHFQRFAMEKYRHTANDMIGAAYLFFLLKKATGRAYAGR
jgi:peptidoglycan/xylan/chitin deacetylase (PgdA/CDA1 family)